MAKKNKAPKPGTIAYTADRHEYYEKAVQCVESEVDMVDETYEALRGKKARFLREDFCGTGNTSCEWVKRRKNNTAIGLDLDQEVLNWGIKNKISALNPEQQDRIDLINQDVMNAEVDPADVILAMNFSYQLFKTRDALRAYFAQAREGLKDDGIFFIDAYGGHESWRQIREKTKFDDFDYFWHQKRYNPITAEMLCHIHFRFKDKSWLHKAFTYDWRMWTLPELQELLVEAGFSKVQVYWEGTDEETGEGNGDYYPTDLGDDDPSWIVYIVCEK
ncbi:MAG: class I SAM-dependent methyltransferase [Acidiferrobacterales bacterium]|nr:class I SAM-dependent methyltransferase [Acidiferrobacterales bacterium]